MGKIDFMFGLPGGRQHTTRVNGKWVFDSEAHVKYYRPLSNAGYKLSRKLPWSVWGIDSVDDVFCPYLVVGGKFNLIDDPNSTGWNQAWFEIKKQEIKIENSLGLCYVQDLCFTNGWDKVNSQGVHLDPWMNNVQGLKGWYSPAADKYLKAFIRKMIIETSGMDIVFPQGNELNGMESVRVCREVINPTLKEYGLMPFGYGGTFKRYYPFKYFAPALLLVKRFGLNPKDLIRSCRIIRDTPSMFDTLNSGEKKTVNVVANGSTASALHEQKKDVGTLFGERAQFVVFKFAHDVCGVDDEQFLFPMHLYDDDDMNFGTSDDGEQNGNSPCDRNADGTYIRPSKEQFKALVKEMLRRKKVGDMIVEHTPERTDLRDCHVAVGEAMSQAMFEMTGSWPVNYHQHPEPVEPEPDPVTPPVKPPFNFIGWLSNNRGYISAAILLGLIIIAFAC